MTTPGFVGRSARYYSAEKLDIAQRGFWSFSHSTLIACWLCAGLASATRMATAALSPPATPPARFIVKLREPMAKEVEAAFALPTMTLSSPSKRVEAWLDKHQIKTLRPLYPGHLQQRLRRGDSDRQIAELTRMRSPQRGQRVAGTFDPPALSRTYVVEGRAGSLWEQESALLRVLADPEVEWAQLDHIVRAQFTPNDPYFATYGSWGQDFDDLYGLKRIGCSGAWDLAKGTGIVVAVIDTGIDYTHLDITNRVWFNPGEVAGNGIDDDNNGYVDDARGWDFVGSHYYAPQPDNDPTDVLGHGTHVAGTIAAEGDNSVGVIGAAWGARIMAVRGLDDAGYGLDSTLAEAIVYAAENGADIINASWGGKGSAPALEEAVVYATSLGVVFTAAAGNANADMAQFYPACFASSISVSAYDAYDNKASFSNHGQRLDVAAPGVSILSLRAANTAYGTPLDEKYSVLSGTSMAAPHVAGAVALLLSLNPTYGPEEVRQALRLSADDVGAPGFDINSGYGRINTSRALTSGPVLQARIFRPANESAMLGLTSIEGVAWGSGFAKYILDYGAGDQPTIWTMVTEGTAPVAKAGLGVIDASNLPDSRYTVRLRVFDTSGSVFEDRIRLNLGNTTITSPTHPAVQTVAAVYKPGAPVEVSGTAIGLRFRQFNLEWARGIDPVSGWSSIGMTLAGGGYAPVTNGLLAVWNSGAITQADFYSIRVLLDNTSFTNETRTFVYLEPDLYSTNWPRWLDQAPVENESVLPVRDVSGHTRLAAVTPYLITTSPQSWLWLFEVDGSLSRVTELARGSYMQPAISDLDGLAGDELVVAEWRTSGQSSGSLRVFKPDGSTYVVAPPTFSNFQYALVTAPDLDGDSVPELVAFGMDRRSSDAWLWAWKANGQLFSPQYPIHFADANPYMYGYPKVKRVVPLDIEADGKAELLVVAGDTEQSFSLHMLRGSGEPAEWPIQVFPGYFRDLVAADFDHDGRPEIVVSYTDAANSNSSVVQILTPNGIPFPGWPLNFGSVAPAQLALADLDRDGTNELIFSTYRDLHVYRADGTKYPGAWPVHGTSVYQGHGWPVAGDIDGDGRPEIVVMRDDVVLPAGGSAYHDVRVLAYRRDGTLSRSWRLLGANGNQPCGNGTPVIGDFDGDGLAEMAVNYQLISGGDTGGSLVEGVVTVLRLGASWNPDPGDWPMNFHDTRNSSCSFMAAKLQAVSWGSALALSWPVQPWVPVLECAQDLVGSAWSRSQSAIVCSNGMNSSTVDSAGSNLFFRLRYPPHQGKKHTSKMAEIH